MSKYDQFVGTREEIEAMLAQEPTKPKAPPSPTEVKEMLNAWHGEFTQDNPRGVWIVRESDTTGAYVSDLVRQYHKRWELCLPSDFLYEVIVECLEYGAESGQDSWCGSFPVPVYYDDLAKAYVENRALIDSVHSELVEELGLSAKNVIADQIMAALEWLYHDCLNFFYSEAQDFIASMEQLEEFDKATT